MDKERRQSKRGAANQERQSRLRDQEMTSQSICDIYGSGWGKGSRSPDSGREKLKRSGAG